MKRCHGPGAYVAATRVRQYLFGVSAHAEMKAHVFPDGSDDPGRDERSPPWSIVRLKPCPAR